jgi:hypothetical protein
MTWTLGLRLVGSYYIADLIYGIISVELMGGLVPLSSPPFSSSTPRTR